MKKLIFAAIAFVFLFGILSAAHKRALQSTGPQVNAEASALAKTIRDLEGTLSARPDDVSTMIALSQAYLQQVRETADTTYFRKAVALMDQAEKLDPKNPEIPATRSVAATGFHHFGEALLQADKAIALLPIARHYGLKVDPLVEMGRYDEAVDALQTMVDLRPDFASYSRISYLRELNGDVEGAIEAMQDAVDAGAGFAENLAWGEVQLGKLTLSRSLDEAQAHFHRALSLVPEYPPAHQGLGKIAFANGDYRDAQIEFEKAFDLLPIAEYATDVADIHRYLGDEATAKRYENIVTAAFSQFEAGGTNIDLEMATFLADHDRDLATALTRARAAYRDRPSIYGADALAWALFKNGQAEEAWKYSIEARRTKSKDPSILYHAAKIAEALKKSTEAKDLYQQVMEINPHFSIRHDKELQAIKS